MRGEPYRPRINEPSPPRNFHQQFQLINRQNQELIQLADNITRSSFMQPSYPHIIAQLQQQLRRNLSIFVDSIREYFVDMDTRLRALAEALDQQIKREEQQHHRKRMVTMQVEDPRSRGQFNTNYGFRNNPIQTDPYQLFSQKISALQISLRQTQKNQGKLIQMVDKLSKKSENLASMGQQSEPPRYLRPELKQDIARQPSNNSFERDHQSSFRLFSLKNKSKKDNHQAQRVTTSLPMVCGSLAVTESRSNFGQVYPQNIIDSTHNYNHRVNFMLRTLNS